MILLDEPDRANIWENYFRVSGSVLTRKVNKE